MDTAWPPASVEAIEEISEGDDRAGATAAFIGTTRNSFKGKIVTRLDYQAYSKLAIKTMSGIIRSAHEKYSDSAHKTAESPVMSIIHCAVHHRLGTVPVGEPSIVIAVSSPHRKEAFHACEYILEEVKLKAQIWKREFYEGEREEDAEWKANVS
ncbi:unnamed protein product [Somion occarium]|uniref:Molybdopterin synthase catalytic subunit n=1 Tax=Somion occarium TaxID=3059160 RepID=A0ABP1CNH6_9APHY